MKDTSSVFWTCTTAERLSLRKRTSAEEQKRDAHDFHLGHTELEYINSKKAQAMSFLFTAVSAVSCTVPDTVGMP